MGFFARFFLDARTFPLMAFLNLYVLNCRLILLAAYIALAIFLGGFIMNARLWYTLPIGHFPSAGKISLKSSIWLNRC